MKNFTTQNEERRLNELLFENRNKNYGAYVLRKEEGLVLQKAMFIGAALITAISITPLLLNSLSSTDKIETPEFSGHILRPVDEIPEIKPPTVAPVVPIQPQITTVKLDVPTPTKNPLVETPPAAISQIKDSQIGTENITAEPSTNTYTPPIVLPTNGTPTAVAPPKVVNNEPVSVVDVEANFTGGINAFRTKVVQNFNTNNFEGSSDLMKATITFIVEKDGTISNIKANGNDRQFNAEAERTISKIKGKWMPAKLNGENVRSYFKFPISMQFE